MLCLNCIYSLSLCTMMWGAQSHLFPALLPLGPADSRMEQGTLPQQGSCAWPVAVSCHSEHHSQGSLLVSLLLMQLASCHSCLSSAKKLFANFKSPDSSWLLKLEGRVVNISLLSKIT